MAERTEGSITIDADRETVLGVICDFEAMPEWTNEIKHAEIRERDADGRATHVYYEVQAAGVLNAKYTLSYTYKADGSGIEWTMIEGSPIKQLDGEYELSDGGATTEVTYRATVDPGIPMLGFLKRKAEKVVIDTALKGLKKRVESLR